MPRQSSKTKNSDRSDAASASGKTSSAGEIIFFALVGVAVLAVLAYGAVDVWALGLLALIVGAIGLLWLADAWRSGEFSFNTSLLPIPLFGLIAVGLVQLLPLRAAADTTGLLAVPVSNALSLAPAQTRFALIQLATYLVFFAAALRFIDNQNRIRKTVVAVVVFGALIGFFAVLQQLAGVEGIYGLRQTSAAFTYGSYVNRHHFAALMEMTIALTLALLFGKSTKNDKRIFLIAAAVVMGIAIILTGSRGGLISLFAVLVFIVMANMLRKNRTVDEDSAGEDVAATTNFRRNLLIIGGGLALVFGLLGAVIMLGADDALLRGTGLTFERADISNGRAHFWATALKIFADYPILGTGLDSFEMIFTRYDTWNGFLRVEQAHNDYLQIMTDAGIAGLLCVLAFIILLFRASLKIIAASADNFQRSTAVGALAGCFGILIHSAFDFPLRTPANGYFFLLLAVLATATVHYPKLQRRRKSTNAAISPLNIKE